MSLSSSTFVFYMIIPNNAKDIVHRAFPNSNVTEKIEMNGQINSTA